MSAPEEPPTFVEAFGGNLMDPVADPYPVYARLRREQRVARMQLLTGPGVLVLRYDDVLPVLRDSTLYSSRINADGIGLVMGRTILEMDGKEHGRHRGIASTFFVPKTLRTEVAGVAESIAHQLIDRFDRLGRAELVSQFTRTFPMRVIAHVIGIPVEDYEPFQQWAMAISGFSDDPPAGFAAAQALVDFLRPIVAERKREPRPDLMSALVHAEIDGHRLTDEEVYGFLRLLVPAGAETTYRLIGNTLFALLTHPDQLDEVRADRSQIPWAIEESLRWEAPVCFASRETTTAVTLGGVDLPPRIPMLVVLSSANRDELRYEDPDRFDIHRHDDDHTAFGGGKHFCLGAHLGRLETTIALQCLFDRLQNLRLDSSSDAAVVGLAFRSPNRIPVRFD